MEKVYLVASPGPVNDDSTSEQEILDQVNTLVGAGYTYGVGQSTLGFQSSKTPAGLGFQTHA